MQFSKCRLKLDFVSAFNFVQDYDTFIHERLLSTRVANVARAALSQTYFGWWASFAQFGTSGIHVFWVQQPSELSIQAQNLLSSANKFHSFWCSSISVHVPTSCCCCGLQPFVLGDENCACFYDVTTRMLCFVLQDS